MIHLRSHPFHISPTRRHCKKQKDKHRTEEKEESSTKLMTEYESFLRLEDVSIGWILC